MNYTSYKTVADAYKRDYPFDDNWATDPDIREWIGECLFEMNAVSWLKPKVLDCSEEGNPCIEIKGYKGILPSDLVAVAQGGVKRVDHGFNSICMPASGSWFMSHDKNNLGLNSHSHNREKIVSLQYEIYGNIITTSFDEGKIQLSYLAIPTDDDGEPMIPNSEEVISACKSYIAEKVMTKLYLNGQIDDKRMKFIQQQCYYNKAKGVMKLMFGNADEILEAFKDFSSLIRPKYSNYYAFTHRGQYRF